MASRFLNRDISWLSFNGRVLGEAMRNNVPLMERFKFLSIFSSNLDEFYRVRMPSMMLFHEVSLANTDEHWLLFREAREIINRQQEDFGKTLREDLIPALQQYNIELLYSKPVPAALGDTLKEHFQAEVMAFLEITSLSNTKISFFAKSNALYQAVFCRDKKGHDEVLVINVPSNKVPRFFTASLDGKQYIIFLEDIIKRFLHLVLPLHAVDTVWNIKITRDAELDLADEYEGDLAEKIEKQLSKRDDGGATRFLYETGMPSLSVQSLLGLLNLSAANAVEGGPYHNLKDLGSLPVKIDELNYPKMPSLVAATGTNDSVFANVIEKDRAIHAPFHSYNTVLKFFNEAAVDETVKEIYTTLYRVAGDSRIVNSLITAAKNGKKVTVFIELKARFDEENNIRWSKRMKAAGVNIINSIPGLKVHAKVALVKRKLDHKMQYLGLVATGNLNEVTARFYTDHILFTTHAGIMRELELLFVFLSKRRKPKASDVMKFDHLLVAQFNLQRDFLTMIDTEISNAKLGKPAGIIIKMNNLEEKVLIKKLYEASNAGVKVQMIVRSTCCLAPGVRGQSENISVIRIVDRYLEHGRVFIFTNGGDEKIFIGSADWMNRNVYRRIEVCCPVYDEDIKNEIRTMTGLQLRDNVQAVVINEALDNKPVQTNEAAVQSQNAIYTFLKSL